MKGLAQAPLETFAIVRVHGDPELGRAGAGS